MKNIFSKNRWILGLTIVILVFIGGIFYFQNNSSLIKSSAVWSPTNTDWMKKWYECKDTVCSSDIMKQNGASSEAINFTKLLSENLGYLSKFQEMGKVDLGTVFFPKRANTNEITYFLNGTPSLLSTDIIKDDNNKVMEEVKHDPLYKEMLDKYPNIELWGLAPEFIEKKSNEYIFKYEFNDDCHACVTEYSAIIGFNFNYWGKFLNIKFINIEKGSILSLENLKNAEYGVEEKFTLTNGKYSGARPYGPKDSRTPSQFDGFTDHFELDTQNIAYNNSDPKNADKVAVIISENNGGGTGEYRGLVIMGVKDYRPQQISTTEGDLDDRSIIKDISFIGNIISVHGLFHGPGDGMCCPTHEKTLVFELTSSNKLVESK